MELTFNFGIVFGKGDSNDWEELVEVTEEEYNRLVDASRSGEDFCRCKAVKDIYDRIYDIADLSATESLKEYDPDLVEDYADDEDFRASDIYEIIVNYPIEIKA
jgi:hypothetical protein